MSYKNEPINFGIEDVGSKILERFSDDMYSSESTLRELVKNASDSYYQLEAFCDGKAIGYPKDYVSDKKEVSLVIANNQLFIQDKGVGCDRDDIKKLIKIAISEKLNIPGATGFRGIGFWAAFSAGDKIIVESSKYKSTEKCILEVNTAKIRKNINSKTDIGKIMNDKSNISLKIGEADLDTHYTQITIQCIGKPGIDVGEKENRLYDFIHESDEKQMIFLKKTCTQYLPDAHPLLSKITEFYDDANIPLIAVNLNGKLLRKDFDASTNEFKMKSLNIQVEDGSGLKDVEVARCWYIRNKDKSAELKGSSGFRIFKDGYPVGGQNMFSDERYGYDKLSAKAKINYFAGEVHILMPELTADANGENLTDGEYKKGFIKSLRLFYQELISEAYYQSALLNRIDDFSGLCANIEKYQNDNDKVQPYIEASDKIIKEYQSNIKGPKGNLDKKNLRVIDRMPKVKAEAQKLIKLYSLVSKKYTGKSSSKKAKTPQKAPILFPSGANKEPEDSKSGEALTSTFQLKSLKSKLQQLLIDKLSSQIAPDDMEELLKEVEAIFES